MKLVFMGSPEFSVPALNALVTAGHKVACVYCQPPRPAGRGKKERPTAVHARALEIGLPVRHPVSLKSTEAQEEFAGLGADLAVVVAYGLLLPRGILEAPRLGCLNIHASLLPRWRGAAPIHRAIIAGDETTGVCIMQMEEGLDTGPVLLRATTPIGVEETTGQLHDRLSEVGADLIVSALVRLARLSPERQAETGISYAHKIDKAEARVDWTRPAVEVDRLIRGLSPFPGAWTEYQGQRLKLVASRVTTGAGKPGEVLDDGLTVACGQQAVELLRLQRSGKGIQDKKTFLQGYKIPSGTFL